MYKKKCEVQKNKMTLIGHIFSLYLLAVNNFCTSICCCNLQSHIFIVSNVLSVGDNEERCSKHKHLTTRWIQCCCIQHDLSSLQKPNIKENKEQHTSCQPNYHV